MDSASDGRGRARKSRRSQLPKRREAQGSLAPTPASAHDRAPLRGAEGGQAGRGPLALSVGRPAGVVFVRRNPRVVLRCLLEPDLKPSKGLCFLHFSVSVNDLLFEWFSLCLESDRASSGGHAKKPFYLSCWCYFTFCKSRHSLPLHGAPCTLLCV